MYIIRKHYQAVPGTWYYLVLPGTTTPIMTETMNRVVIIITPEIPAAAYEWG